MIRASYKTHKDLPGVRSQLVFPHVPGLDTLRGTWRQERIQTLHAKGEYVENGQRRVSFSLLCCHDSELQRERNTAGTSTGEFNVRIKVPKGKKNNKNKQFTIFTHKKCACCQLELLKIYSVQCSCFYL